MTRSRSVVAVLVAVGLGVVWGRDPLARHSLLYGVLEVTGAVAEGNGSDCFQHLDALKRGIQRRELWALKMLDSSGNPGPGFLWGNNYWLGSQAQCRDLHDRSPFITATTLQQGYRQDPTSWPPFPVEFYMAAFRHNSSLQVHVELPNEDLITVGLCLPEVCPAHYIGRLLRTLVAQKPLLHQDIYDVDMRLELVRSLKEDKSWLREPKFIIMAVVLLSVVLLMIAGTIYDTVYWQPYLSCLERDNLQNTIKCQTPLENTNNTNNANETETPPQQIAPTILCEERQQGGLGRFLMCFSIYTNTGLLLNTTISPESVPAIHGLRFMSMVWIIMVHTVFFMPDYLDNKPRGFRLGTGFIVQVISNSTLSTDSFFCISGFLVAYLFYQSRRGMKQLSFPFKRQVCTFGLMVLKRFLRLTPLYMIILGIVDINMSWRSRTSVFHMMERPDEVCTKYWWRNLLYINNFFGSEEMCMSWSWYLSNDMQFFIIGTFLLILSTSLMALSVSLLVAMTVGCCLISGYVSYSHSYVPTLDQQLASLNFLYYPPWVRIGPYLVGMVAGYLVVRLNGKLGLNKCTVAGLWILGSACNVCVLFGIYDRNLSLVTSAIYVAVSRTAWGLGLSWVIVACCTNNAGFINRILSFPAWVPLSRLTYCAYLLNPLIINSIYQNSDTALHPDVLQICSMVLGHVGVTYFSAYVASLAFETPAILLLKQLVDRQPKKAIT